MVLIELDPNARCEGSRLINEHSGAEIVTLSWNGRRHDPNGHIGVTIGRLENGNTTEVLVMQSKWVAHGSIKAWFPWFVLPNNAIFKASVGFLDIGNGSDGVTFQVWEHINHEGREIWNRIIDFKKEYDNVPVAIEADLSHLSGQNVGIELRVDAGVGYGRDHAVYLNPRIEERAIGPRANKWVIQPTLLTVNDRNEESRIKGRGDEPALVAIYFRSIFGRKGSTKLKIMDSILKLGNNIRAGITVAIPNEANLSVHDSGITANTEIDILGTSLVVMGCVFAAVELDNVGTEIVRSKISEKADKLKTALIEHIEGNPIPVPPPANFFTDILSQIDTDVNGSASGVSGGGFDLFGRLISNTGHDLIGTNQVVIIGASSDILRESFGDDYRPDSLTNPKAALEQGDFRIDSGARMLIIH